MGLWDARGRYAGSRDTDEPEVRAVIIRRNQQVKGALAKQGMKLRFEDKTNPSKAELMSDRSDLRRLINFTLASNSAKGYTNEEEEIIDECSRLIAMIDDKISLIETGDAMTAEHYAKYGGDAGWRDSEGRKVAVLSKANISQAASIIGVEGDMGFDLGDFVRGVAGVAGARKLPEGVRAAITEGTDSQGGFTVPSVLLPGFVQALVANSSLMQAGAKMMMLDPQAKSFRLAKSTTIPTAAWRLESGAVAQSDPAFGAVDFAPKSLAFYFKVSAELLQDSPNITEILNDVIGKAFAREWDRAGLLGTGTNPEPLGLANTPGIGAIAFGGTNGAPATNYSWVLSAYQAILLANAPAPDAVILNPQQLIKHAGFLDTTNQPLVKPELIREMLFAQTSQLPQNQTVGTSTDCTTAFVGNFADFVFGLRQDVTIVKADQLHIGTGEIGFYCFTRADTQVLRPQSFVRVTGLRA